MNASPLLLPEEPCSHCGHTEFQICDTGVFAGGPPAIFYDVADHRLRVLWSCTKCRHRSTVTIARPK